MEKSKKVVQKHLSKASENKRRKKYEDEIWLLRQELANNCRRGW